MTLEIWKQHGWLQDHKTSKDELSNLLLLVDRDLQDSINKEISLDWLFNIAYNAGLQLAAMVLHSAGYRVGRGESKHYRVIQAIPLVLGNQFTIYRDFFARVLTVVIIALMDKKCPNMLILSQNETKQQKSKQMGQ